MDYSYEEGDELALIARLGPHFGPYAEPLDIQEPIAHDPIWNLLRPDLQVAGHRLLRLELDEDARSSASVSLGESNVFEGSSSELSRPSDSEQKLWAAVAAAPTVPSSVEVVARDLLLSTGVDRSPSNADAVIAGYRAIGEGPADSLHVALAILRANAIARARNMPVEVDIREDILTLAERALVTNVYPGLVLRHARAIAEPPRTGARSASELDRLAKVLDGIEQQNHDASTVDWIASIRIRASQTDEDRLAAQRRHVDEYIGIAEADDQPMRAMIWAEKAVTLAIDYGLQDRHDKAVLLMQKLSRQDFGWRVTQAEVTIPNAVFKQRARQIARLSSWEQALAMFLSTTSPTGNTEKNKKQVASTRRGLLDLASGRTFGTHQMPERTHGTPEQERLAQLEQITLGGTGTILRVDLVAMAQRFGIPGEDEIVAVLTLIFGATETLVRPFAQALRYFWAGDVSGAARVAIPLIEASARELLFLMDEPLYRLERGASPGRFPAMDFYVDKLEELDLDPDWVAALRATLLSGGQNLRNRLAHGFQIDFTAEEAAVLIRLAGLFIAMPVGTGAADDERTQHPLEVPRKPLRRRLGWVWR